MSPVRRGKDFQNEKHYIWIQKCIQVAVTCYEKRAELTKNTATSPLPSGRAWSDGTGMESDWAIEHVPVVGQNVSVRRPCALPLYLLPLCLFSRVCLQL